MIRVPGLMTCRRRIEAGVVLGGGGALGISFHLGFLRGLESQGVILRNERMLGVSAGTWAAGAMTLNLPIESLIEVYPRLRQTPHAPVAEVAAEVFGDARDARVNGAAVRWPSGRRVLLDGADVPIADIVAASSSPPRLAGPVHLEGRRLVDPGVVSNTCADLAAPRPLLVVLAPLTSGALKSQGLLWEQRLRQELWHWKRSSPGKVVLIRPEPEVYRWAGRSWSDVLDVDRMARTYRLAFEHGRRCPWPTA